MQELIIKWQRFVYFFSLPFSAYIHNNTFGASVLSMSTLLSCVASILQMNTLIVCHLKVDIVYLCISPWIVVFSKMAAVTKCILVMKTEHEAWTRHSVFTSNFFFLPLPFENRISIGLLFPPLLAASLFVNTFCVVPMPMRCTYAWHDAKQNVRSYILFAILDAVVDDDGICIPISWRLHRSLHIYYSIFQTPKPRRCCIAIPFSSFFPIPIHLYLQFMRVGIIPYYIFFLLHILLVCENVIRMCTSAAPNPIPATISLFSMLSWFSLPSQVQRASRGKVVVLLHFTF